MRALLAIECTVLEMLTEGPKCVEELMNLVTPEKEVLQSVLSFLIGHQLILEKSNYFFLNGEKRPSSLFDEEFLWKLIAKNSKRLRGMSARKMLITPEEEIAVDILWKKLENELKAIEAKQEQRQSLRTRYLHRVFFIGRFPFLSLIKSSLS
jgi:hypothetical protein